MSLQLNTDPYTHKEVCGFMFHISFSNETGIGVDQWGGKWRNRNNPEPIDSGYLDVFMDAFNSIKAYSDKVERNCLCFPDTKCDSIGECGNSPK